MLEKNIVITSFDVYPNSVMKPSSLMRYLQQIAREDCDNMGCTYPFMRSLNTVFVLTKLAIRFNRPVMAGESVVLKTYNNSINGIIFDREFELTSKDEPLAYASSFWTLVKYDTRSLVRPKDFPVQFEALNYDIEPIFIPRRLPEDGLLVCARHTVRTSDLDENNHLNNCVYADIALDSISEFDGLKKWVSGIKLIFRHEAKRGDSLIVSRSESGDKTIVFAFNETENKPCFEAELQIDEV